MVKSVARFSTFQRGRIVGQAEAGASRKHMRKTCRKNDGKQAGMRAIDESINDNSLGMGAAVPQSAAGSVASSAGSLRSSPRLVRG